VTQDPVSFDKVTDVSLWKQSNSAVIAEVNYSLSS